MGLFDKFRKKKGKEPSDMELYNAYLINMGNNIKLARSEELPGGIKLASKQRASWALKAIHWGIRAYRVFHPRPPREPSEYERMIGKPSPIEEHLNAKEFAYSSLLRQFGEEFAHEYHKLHQIEAHFSRRLVLMEPLLMGAQARIIDELKKKRDVDGLIKAMENKTGVMGDNDENIAWAAHSALCELGKAEIANGELVKESIELMEKLAKRIREMLGLV
ncbi:MAG: hypothetical protein OEZ25_00195 [Candidatus Bathyarchaeota archaeon]|nr:hypothetical protein [Candidatus Bathyarchaeota archaeon]